MWPFDYFKKAAPAPVVLTNPASEVTKKAFDARMAEYDRIKHLVAENPAGRELDLRIAQEVTGLPGAGYWRRSDWTTTHWEPCKKGDRSPAGQADAVSSNASVYWQNPDLGLQAIPYYTTDANDMMRLIAHLSETRHSKVNIDIFDATDEDWGTVSISAGDCNCPHDKEYDPNDGHGWTYIDEILASTPMHAVAIAALEFVKKVQPETEKQKASAA